MGVLPRDRTERTAQRWNLLAPRIKKRKPLEPHESTEYSCPAQELYNGSNPLNAWDNFAKPKVPSLHHVNRSTKRPMPQSLLESLPTELLDIILDDEELEKEDIMAVGLASETLWMHALRHVEKQYMSTRAPFAGVEVAVTGTHLRDFPESFDADDMAKSSVGSLNIRRGRGGTIMPIARAVNWAALRTYEVVETSLEREWIPACHIHDTATLVISKKCFSGLLDELRSRCSSLYGGDLSAVWVLRNLTTKQYVECHPRAAWRGASGIINHPLADNMSIDDVLMLRTCWTKEALSGTNYRGQWAGHSFDLVPAVESGVETVPAGEWTAYTDEVVSQINGLREEIQREKMQIEQEKRRLQEELRIAEERRRRDEDERARAAEGTLQEFPAGSRPRRLGESALDEAELGRALRFEYSLAASSSN